MAPSVGSDTLHTHQLPTNSGGAACYVVDDRDLSTDEKFVLMTLMADHYRYGRETTVAELCKVSGWSSKRALAAIHGLLFRKKIQMIPSDRST